MIIWPESNLPPQSEEWGEKVEKEINRLDKKPSGGGGGGVSSTSSEGTPGPTGPEGPPGPQGEQGETGLQGEPGLDGADGAEGAQGPQGEPGPQGEQGIQGEVGPQGPQGEVGSQGETGPQGESGEKGDAGEQGPQGVQGETGPAGAKGDTGDQGPEGIQGPKGDTGDTGPAGATGATGATGAQGQNGFSAYQVAVIDGFTGTESEWLASLVGADGADSTVPGPKGDTGEPGPTGFGIVPGVISQYAGATAPTGYLLCQGQSLSTTEYAGLFNVIGYNYGGSGSSFSVPNLQNRIPVGKGTDAEFDTLGETGGAKTHTLTTNEIANHTHTNSLTGSTVFASSAHRHNYRFSLWDNGYMPTGPNAGMGGPGATPAGAWKFSNSTWAASLSADSTTTTRNVGGAFQSGGITRFVTNGDTDTPSGTASIGLSNASAGGGQAHNNLQPYIVVNYIIKT